MPRKKAVEAGYNEMGQPVDAPKGEVSIEAVKEFQEALPAPLPREPQFPKCGRYGHCPRPTAGRVQEKL